MWPAGAANPERLSGCVRRGWRWPQKPKYGYVELQRGPAPGYKECNTAQKDPRGAVLLVTIRCSWGLRPRMGPQRRATIQGCARLLC